MPLKSKKRLRSYRKGYWKDYYSDPIRRRRHILAVRKREKKLKVRIRLLINEIKIKMGCQVCGFREHAAALDFHHRNKTTKKFSISQATTGRISIKALMLEINKCDILCANHHRMITFS